MVACAMGCIAETLPHPDPITVTTHFLRPGLADEPYQVTVEVLRTGRTMSTARATLSQAGKSRLEVLCAYADLTQSVGVSQELNIAPVDLPPPDKCVGRSEETQGIHLPILDRLDVRLHPQQAVPGGSKTAEMTGWIRFMDSTEPNSQVLPLFADAFPPSVLSALGVVGWVPTLELTVHIRRRPAPGWVRAQLLTEDLAAGRMIESGRLWDSSGALVAQSRQLGLVTP
ncbi:MAG: acyl-CoA thioesterase [Limisphaerales bacterium]|jgi:acyl-CoA thioesterase